MSKHAQFLLAAVIAIFGMVLLTVSLVMPPTGQIDPSVLAAAGEILTFSGAVIGVDYHYKAKQ